MHNDRSQIVYVALEFQHFGRLYRMRYATLHIPARSNSHIFKLLMLLRGHPQSLAQWPHPWLLSSHQKPYR